jgi:acid phosphatase type 7
VPNKIYIHLILHLHKMKVDTCRYLMILIFLSTFIVPILGDGTDVYWSPWVTKTTIDSATINWRGEENGSGVIDYATLSYYDTHRSFDKTIAPPVKATYQHVQLFDLKPNTSYIYRVTPSGREPYDNRTFRTMPINGPFTFIVISDPQQGENYSQWQRFKYVADAIEKEPGILFILIGGDFNDHEYIGLWDQFFWIADGMLSRSAIFPVIGNHEYHNTSFGDKNKPTIANYYHWVFDMPLNYSFDCSGIRFIVLNTPDPNNAEGDDPQTSLALAKSQEPWLREQLDNDSLLGVFTIHHHPIWDYYQDLEPWETLYHAYNISAAFAGHAHGYQRYLINGIPYFIVANAGGRFTDLEENASPSGHKFVMNKALGYLKVTVDPANNVAIAQEWTVATVRDNDSKDKPNVLRIPEMTDSFTFPLKH